MWAAADVGEFNHQNRVQRKRESRSISRAPRMPILRHPRRDASAPARQAGWPALPHIIVPRCRRLPAPAQSGSRAARNSFRGCWFLPARTGHRQHGDGLDFPPPEAGQLLVGHQGVVNRPRQTVRPAASGSWRRSTRAAWAPSRCASTRKVCHRSDARHQGKQSNGRLPAAAVGADRPKARFEVGPPPRPIGSNPEAFELHLAASLSVRFQGVSSHDHALSPQMGGFVPRLFALWVRPSFQPVVAQVSMDRVEGQSSARCRRLLAREAGEPSLSASSSLPAAATPFA